MDGDRPIGSILSCLIGWVFHRSPSALSALRAPNQGNALSVDLLTPNRPFRTEFVSLSQTTQVAEFELPTLFVTTLACLTQFFFPPLESRVPKGLLHQIRLDSRNLMKANPPPPGMVVPFTAFCSILSRSVKEYTPFHLTQ